MKQGNQLIVYPVKDLDRAKARYGEVLGLEPYADAPCYVGFGPATRRSASIPTGTQTA
jgi:catechol 2,3-dioxygenase-like lactoylglutathione lyase family enzyme